jgi:SAM-dependent methyltransferase
VAETAAGHPIVLRVAWGRLDGADPGGAGPVIGQRLGRLRPPAEDLSRPRLPAPLWWGHLAIHPLRVVYARARRAPARQDLGPFLPTPSALVETLLDVAEVGPDDVVADIGCGDGRVLVRAADRGCRSIGVERDPELVAEARRRASDAGVGDRVEVVTGDAADFDVCRATVVVLFLSAASLPGVIADLRARLAVGSRIVAHEQAPLTVTADERRPLFTPGGVTVAHRWDL